MNANERYLEAKVMSATPVELVRMLYRRAIEAVGAARRRLAEGDIRARSREISRAMEITVELAGALDRKQGGEVAVRLAALYDYIGRRLLEANLRQDDGALAEAERLLVTLEEGWAGLSGATPAEAAPSASQSEAAGSAYGYQAPSSYAPAHCWSA